ncbi:MAG: DNA repair protein RecN [Alloprevotella sp.]|nr:DNA repair protein RecN [Alloprevotella sp.]
MLKELHIKNYVLIESLDIELSMGYTVMTGETGAGKSIILGALGLLQGVRADARTIKKGSKKCIVEGHFIAENNDIQAFLEANDIDNEDICIIRREILDTGKSRAFVNDTPVTLSVLRELSALFIDIHSQHQNLLLGREHFLIDTLDSVAKNALLKSEYAQSFKEWKEAESRLAELKEDAQQDNSDYDFLVFQLQQLSELDLKNIDIAALEDEAKMLRHAEDIKSALYQASNALDSEDVSVSSILRNATQSLDSINDVYPDAEAISQRLSSCRIEIDDIIGEILRKADSIEYDAERLTYIDDKLSAIYSLLKKHEADSIEELIQTKENIQRRIERLEDIENLIEKATREAEKSKKQCLEIAAQLTKIRQKAAREVESHILKSLIELGMPHASLSFNFTPRKQPDQSGNDNVTLLFSANRDGILQDVTQTASGGELSRLMLALKTFISSHKNLPTIIFDEIDTGVSGTMAEKMAVQMKQMAAHSQVICITHLPQIAAMGQHHFLVYKEETSQTTATHIRELCREERITEIANMLSGEKLTQAAIENAKTLLG